MSLTITPLGADFAAAITGTDLTEPVPPAIFREIEAAFYHYAVLHFPNQVLSDDQQMAFSNRFGPLETTPTYSGEKRRIERREIVDISNLNPEGRVMSSDDPRLTFNRANQLWHTDSSFKHVPARCSLLSAREIPPEGGETEFADMRAGYDALPPQRQREIEELVAEHSIFHSRAKMGFSEFRAEIREKLPPVRQRIVRRHPGSGRKTLYLASHASHIIGWPADAGAKLIAELIAHATEPRFVYRHTWRLGDLVMWDNRCTMHRGRPYDEARHRRVLHRTTVSDELNSIEREPVAAGAAA